VSGAAEQASGKGIGSGKRLQRPVRACKILAEVSRALAGQPRHGKAPPVRAGRGNDIGIGRFPINIANLPLSAAVPPSVIIGGVRRRPNEKPQAAWRRQSPCSSHSAFVPASLSERDRKARAIPQLAPLRQKAAHSS
jgi:hypothetical protein